MTHAVVQYGRQGYLGQFTIEALEAFGHGDAVVVRSPRGVELGQVLAVRDEPTGEVEGSVLRRPTPADAADADAHDQTATHLLTAAHASALAADLPLAFVDAEILLGGGTAILHALPWAACDATPLLVELGDRYGLAVRLLDLSRTPVVRDPEPAGCGKEGCGKTGGGCSSCSSGCSTGSCSKGKVQSASELTRYFADLRKQMEAQPARVPLL